MSEDLTHSPDSERTVLGAILITEGRALPDVASSVQADEFYHPAHRAIFAVMLELDGKRAPVNTLSVWEALRAGDESPLRALGGQAFLSDLACSVVTTENAAWHAEQIASKAQRRRWRAVAAEIAGLATHGVDDEGFIEAAEAKVFEVMNKRRALAAVPIKVALHEAVGVIQQRAESGEEVTGVASRYAQLDEMTAGFQLGDLIVVAARPSMGKTALAMNLVEAASSAGVPALVFSLEMSRGALTDRMLSSESGVHGTQLKTGKMSTAEHVKVAGAASRLSELQIWIDDTAEPSITDIRSRARRWATREAADAPKRLIVIDYLQLLRGTMQRGRDQDRQREIAEISRGLKALAKDANASVIALSQLSRSLESRADKRPMLSDLRESGAIEQDADVVIFIYRDEVYDADTDEPGIAEIIVGKQRNGPTGMVRLRWRKENTRFEEIVRKERPAFKKVDHLAVVPNWQDGTERD